MRIVVAGAGIAGLSAALALSGRGHEIVLLERRTGFGEPGAGIQLSPNATRILDGWGLAPALARIATEPPGIVVRALRTGREIARIGLGRRMRDRYGAPYLTAARSDFHALLLDAVRAHSDVRLRVGRDVVAAIADGQAIQVETRSAGGTGERVEADLLVGADGVGSSVRRLTGDSRKPAYTGYAAYRATCSLAEMPRAIGTGETGLWLGRAQHAVLYRAGERANLVVVTRRPDTVEGWSHATEPDQVARLLAGAESDLRAAAGIMQGWRGWSLHDLPVRALGTGRTVLIGDAGHPVLPFLAQGGALAIEDAAVLEACLGGADAGGVPAALAAFRRNRLPRVRRVQDQARRTGRFYHAAGPIALARDAVMRRLGPDGMADRYGWIYGWRPG